MSNAVLSFDIGIKNLAWCITNASGQQFEIVGWGNYNLLEDREAETKTETTTCKLCSAKPKVINSTGLYCGRHIPSTHPQLKDLSGTVLKKLPPMKSMKPILQAKFPTERKLPSTKETMIAKLQEFSSIPAPKVKSPNAMALDVSKSHDSIRKFITTQLSKHLSILKEIRLENQPVLKNPVMKTIQILLFATLRDFCIQQNSGQVPVFKLVHAGTKVKGKTTGDKGYKARKEGSEARVLETLKSSKIKSAIEWKTFFEGHKKRSDLADAFCMCLDAYPESAVKQA